MLVEVDKRDAERCDDCRKRVRTFHAGIRPISDTEWVWGTLCVPCYEKLTTPPHPED